MGLGLGLGHSNMREERMAQNALAVDRGVGGLPSVADWGTMLQMADALVQSGMLPKHITTPQAAVAIIQRGRELGIPPMHALSNIVYIQGKPTANSELMLALIYRDHGDGAVVFTRSDNMRCDIAYRRRSWDRSQSYSFTLDDAKQAGLMSNQTWQKYPAAMLRARAISAVARMAFPDSIGGMYSPEELGAAVEIDREGGIVIIDAPTPEPVVVPQVEVIDTSTDEILTGQDIERYELAQRIVAEAGECVGSIHKGRLRLLGQEAERSGLLEDETVLAALRAAKDRVTGGESVNTQQPELVKA